MDLTEITERIRRGIREPKALVTGPGGITDSIADAVHLIGLKLTQVESEYFTKRISISSSTNVFTWPSDCVRVLRVWDLDTTAKTITNASNATPIVITSDSHGFEDDEIIFVHSVTGNTAANGAWKVANKTANTFELYGSVGNAAYTGGGRAFKESGDFGIIKRAPLAENGEVLWSGYTWSLREGYIVIDDPDFANDIVVDYLYRPDSYAEIPADFHLAIVAYAVMDQMKFKESQVKEHPDLKNSFEWHSNLWQRMQDEMTRFCPAIESRGIQMVKRVKAFI